MDQLNAMPYDTPDGSADWDLMQWLQWLCGVAPVDVQSIPVSEPRAPSCGATRTSDLGASQSDASRPTAEVVRLTDEELEAMLE